MHQAAMPKCRSMWCLLAYDSHDADDTGRAVASDRARRVWVAGLSLHNEHGGE